MPLSIAVKFQDFEGYNKTRLHKYKSCVITVLNLILLHNNFLIHHKEVS